MLHNNITQVLHISDVLFINFELIQKNVLFYYKKKYININVLLADLVITIIYYDIEKKYMGSS